MFLYVTTRLLQWHTLQQLECMWWFLLRNVFTGELQSGSGLSIWRVSLTRPTQPLRAGGITCLSSTDRGRWRDRYAGLEGKFRAVMREYVNMCENTSNLGLDFAIQKLREVFFTSQYSNGLNFVFRGRASSFSDTCVVAHPDLSWMTVHPSLPPALNHCWVNPHCSEIHAPRCSTDILVFIYKLYNTYFYSCAQDREATSDKICGNNNPQAQTKYSSVLFYFLFISVM